MYTYTECFIRTGKMRGRDRFHNNRDRGSGNRYPFNRSKPSTSYNSYGTSSAHDGFNTNYKSTPNMSTGNFSKHNRPSDIHDKNTSSVHKYVSNVPTQTVTGKQIDITSICWAISIKSHYSYCLIPCYNMSILRILIFLYLENSVKPTHNATTTGWNFTANSASMSYNRPSGSVVDTSNKYFSNTSTPAVSNTVNYNLSNPLYAASQPPVNYTQYPYMVANASVYQAQSAPSSTQQ